MPIKSHRDAVFFPVESLTGLGHLNRTGKLVRDMVKAGLMVSVSSGSFIDPQRFFAGAECHAIPPVVCRDRERFFTIDGEGKRTILENFNEAARKQERTDAQLANFRDAKANILISEFWPFNRPSVDGEMEALLAASKNFGKDTLRLASVRDVLEPLKDKDEVVSESGLSAREAWTVKTLNENFDAVLVHGDQDFIPLSETFAAASAIRIPVIYTGYVIDELPQRRVAANDASAPIVVSCGAGYNSHEMVFSFLTSWQQLVARKGEPEVANLVDRPVHIITGPRFHTEALRDVTEWTQAIERDTGQPITVERYRDDFTNILAGAAFSVSFAGYNTTLETLAMDVPALLIPNYTIHGGHLKINPEQIYRLQRLAEKGLAAYAHPDDVQHSKKFADILLREFTRQTGEEKSSAKLNFSGAANTIAAISDLMRDKRTSAVSFPLAAQQLSVAS